MDSIHQLAANVRGRFVVYSTFSNMSKFLDTFDRATGDKPDYVGFTGPFALYKDNLKGLDVNCTNGQVIDDRYAPHVATEIRGSLIDGGVTRPPDVIVDGNSFLPAIRYLAQNWKGHLTPEELSRLYIVVEGVPTGPVVTHDLDFAQSVAFD